MFEINIVGKALEGSHITRSETFEEVVRRRLSRRALLTGILKAAPLLVLAPVMNRSALAAHAPGTTPAPAEECSEELEFEPIALSNEDRVIVPPDYAAQVLIRWGDPLFPGVPPFDVHSQTPLLQTQRFGFNCDFLGFFSLPQHRSQNPSSGLLCVNHEYTSGTEMFPGYAPGSPTLTQVDIELAAHGVTVVEVKRRARGQWQYDVRSPLNRRVTGETPIDITGPAAGHDWMKVSYDSTGTRVRGMLNNCGGGKTPWGTLLTCEENFNQYFANAGSTSDLQKRTVHRRYGLPKGTSERRWEQYHNRFDLALEPNEPFRFGWVVEIDPYNPSFAPNKRTALGRFKHEAATVVLAPDNRAVVYSGDDERFDYMYKFVSAGSFNRAHREANFGLLDTGTLYVAKFHDDGTGTWLPLVYGQDPLIPANGFSSQGDVLINTRGAADRLGATKMDRPEDIETNPVNHKVYCVMTNNTSRTAPNGPNPRSNNRHGHIIELTEAGDDPTALMFTWEIFMLCGDPNNPADGAFFAECDPGDISPISRPDNITFDCAGNLWIATDGQPSSFGKNDGIFAVPVDGSERGCVRQFLSGPVDAELASLEFNTGFTALFASVQHPGEGGGLVNPTSTWPDGTSPPRPTVVAIVKTDPEDPVIGS